MPRPLYLLLGLLLSCTPSPQASDHGPRFPEDGAERNSSFAQALAATGPDWTAMQRMGHNRVSHTSTLLPTGEVLIVGGHGYGYRSLSSAELYDPAHGAWSLVGTMQWKRGQHSATLLPNGKVLVVGGLNSYNAQVTGVLSSAELYDPATRVWSSGGNLKTARYDHTATLMPNGKVLVVGGVNQSGTLNSVEEYDPASNQWSTVPSLHEARSSHTSTLLPDGTVLVLGADDYGRSPPVASFEVYDPGTRRWTSKPLPWNVFWHTSTLLLNGKVLVAGGFRAAGSGSMGTSKLVALYDPSSGTWSGGTPLAYARSRHTATLFADGRVLVSGGGIGNPQGDIKMDTEVLRSAEIYDPKTDRWSTTGELVVPRSRHTATLLSTGRIFLTGGVSFETSAGSSMIDASTETYDSSTLIVSENRNTKLVATTNFLPDGKLLVIGGTHPGYFFRDSWVYSPTTSNWSSAALMLRARSRYTATSLPDGQVLVIGGEKDQNADSVELYTPETGSWSLVSELKPGRQEHTATLLPNGKVLVVGGKSLTSKGTIPLPINSASLYDPGTHLWSSAGFMQSPRSRHSATLLPNGKVLVVGGSELGDERPFAGAELYDPATNSWSSGGTLAAARVNHTATLLRNGKVLVIGGSDTAYSYSPDMEMYDPDTNRWSLSGSTPPRRGHTSILLPTGRILVLGGLSDNNPSSENLAYDPDTKKWSSVDKSTLSWFPTATLLPNGKVWVLSAWTSLLIEAPLGQESSRPVLTQVSPTMMEPGGDFTVAGTGFRGLSDFPLVSLSSVGTGQWFPLSWRSFSDTSVSARLPYVAVGQYLLNITVNTVTSSKVIYVQNKVPPSTKLAVLAPVNPSSQETLTRETTARFSFTSNDVDLASFECQLDENPFSACSSPREYLSLRDGEHIFRARSRDLAGNVDQDPPRFHWMIDTIPPDVSLSTVPPVYSSSSTGLFAFTSNAPDAARFDCILDEVKSQCVSPQSSPALKEGNHSFQVQVTDKAGNSTMSPRYSWTVDTVAPSPVLKTRLPPYTNTDNVSFAFSAEEGVTFECSMDAPIFTPCLSGQIYASLKDGRHSFQLRATDQAGNTTTLDPYSWVSDTVPPTTRFSMAPTPATRFNDAAFSFSSDEGARLECRLDGIDIGPCSSPRVVSALKDGEHTFQVQATDLAGNIEDPPQKYSWTVDTVAPTADLTSKPPLHTNIVNASFVFSAEEGVTFECSMDAPDFTPCQSGQIYASLKDGRHSFKLRVTDPAGNTTTLKSYSWTLDTVPPATELLMKPPPATKFTDAAFSFSSKEEGVSFACRLDGIDIGPCSSPRVVPALKDGEHTFEVQAADQAGNIEDRPQKYSWTVDTVSPETPSLQVPAVHQRVFTSTPVVSGTSEPGANVQVFIDGQRAATTKADDRGAWVATTSALTWGPHTLTVVALDPAENTSPPSLARPFITEQRGYYGMGCGAGPTSPPAWPLALLALRLAFSKRTGR